MNWNSQLEVQYLNSGVPYSTTGNFMDFFDGLTYEHVNFIFSSASHVQELLELGEAVGTQSRGFSQEMIALLPTSKYKCNFFSRKKSRDERCVIWQLEYRRGDRQITLPCKHVYHSDCGSRWLSLNKACPICYSEVFGDALKH